MQSAACVITELSNSTIQPPRLFAKDFSQHKSFPGTDTSIAYLAIMRGLDWIDRIPGVVFGGVLMGLAVVSMRGWAAVGLWMFFLSDWLWMALLPRARKSFGPSKPPAFCLACMRVPFALLPAPWNFAAQAVGTGLVVYGFWIEPHRLCVTRQKLASAKLNGGRPLRVVHFSDLHLERLTGRERRLIKEIRAASPDIVLYSGDFLNLSYLHDSTAQAECREFLRSVTAPLGIYAVSGSPVVDEPDVVRSLVEGTAVRWLRDECVTIRHEGREIDLIGLSCTHRPFLDAPRLKKLLKDDDARLTILLYHTPDLAPDAARMGIDLQLSGHTHGGQVRLPFYGAIYPSLLYDKQFESGRYQLGAMTLYVTRGIGLEGRGAPRVRFLCPPEVVVWEVGDGKEPEARVIQ